MEIVTGVISYPVRVISVRMDYFPGDSADAEEVLADGERAYVSRYALGRDYHKVMRSRLQKLATRIHDAVGAFDYRVFVDSAPVLEKPLARNAGLGWIGKHTNLINARAGSWFFIGEILTDLPLPHDKAATEHCGTCRACIDACPYDAIAFDEDKTVAQKCNLCYHRVDQGLIPACADNICPAHCIYFRSSSA